MGTGVCLWAVILMTKIRKSGVMVSVAVLQYLIVFVKLQETGWSSDCHNKFGETLMYMYTYNSNKND